VLFLYFVRLWLFEYTRITRFNAKVQRSSPRIRMISTRIKDSQPVVPMILFTQPSVQPQSFQYCLAGTVPYLLSTIFILYHEQLWTMLARSLIARGRSSCRMLGSSPLKYISDKDFLKLESDSRTRILVSNPKKVELVEEFFNKFEFSRNQISRMVKQPTFWLFSDLHNDSLIEYFRHKNFDSSQIATLVSTPFVQYHQNNNGALDFLDENGFTNDMIVSISRNLQFWVAFRRGFFIRGCEFLNDERLNLPTTLKSRIASKESFWARSPSVLDNVTDFLLSSDNEISEETKRRLCATNGFWVLFESGLFDDAYKLLKHEKFALSEQDRKMIIYKGSYLSWARSVLSAETPLQDTSVFQFMQQPEILGLDHNDLVSILKLHTFWSAMSKKVDYNDVFSFVSSKDFGFSNSEKASILKCGSLWSAFSAHEIGDLRFLAESNDHEFQFQVCHSNGFWSSFRNGYHQQALDWLEKQENLSRSDKLVIIGRDSFWNSFRTQASNTRNVLDSFFKSLPGLASSYQPLKHNSFWSRLQNEELDYSRDILVMLQNNKKWNSAIYELIKPTRGKNCISSPLHIFGHKDKDGMRYSDLPAEDKVQFLGLFLPEDIAQNIASGTLSCTDLDDSMYSDEKQLLRIAGFK